jgi:DNA-binding MarR family transcriptional regulator
MSFVDSIKKQTRDTMLHAIREGLVANPSVTLGTVLTELEGDASYKDALLSVTAAEFSQWFAAPATKAPKAPKESTDRPIENWETAKEGHIATTLEFLTTKGLGEGDHARGFSPADLRAQLGGTETQMREVLKALEERQAVGFTGDTKGKRYVVTAVLPQAQAAFEAWKAAKVKAEQERADRAAKAKAEGKAPKGKAKAAA